MKEGLYRCEVNVTITLILNVNIEAEDEDSAHDAALEKADEVGSTISDLRSEIERELYRNGIDKEITLNEITYDDHEVQNIDVIEAPVEDEEDSE